MVSTTPPLMFCRTKQKPRWPSLSLHKRGHTSHTTRPSSSALQYRPGTTEFISPLMIPTRDRLSSRDGKGEQGSRGRGAGEQGSRGDLAPCISARVVSARPICLPDERPLLPVIPTGGPPGRSGGIPPLGRFALSVGMTFREARTAPPFLPFSPTCPKPDGSPGRCRLDQRA